MLPGKFPVDAFMFQMYGNEAKGGVVRSKIL